MTKTKRDVLNTIAARVTGEGGDLLRDQLKKKTACGWRKSDWGSDGRVDLTIQRAVWRLAWSIERAISNLKAKSPSERPVARQSKRRSSVRTQAGPVVRERQIAEPGIAIAGQAALRV
jgi:hypothetical protein